MATSNYRKKNISAIQKDTDALIGHTTGLRPEDENFLIAQDFIMGNLMNNTFQDTNENEVGRMIDALAQKQRIHNQHDRAERLKYLVETFKKMPMK